MKGPSSSTSLPPLQLILIAALSPSNGIGQNGTLPWKLPSEMSYFRRITSKAPTSEQRNAVVMGRNTWNSIPPKFRPLKGRTNVVISAHADAKELGIDASQDAHLFSTLSDAVAYLDTRRISTSTLPALYKTFLIGGAQLYASAQSLYQRQSEDNAQAATLAHMLLTRIHEPAFAECDVFLPEFRTEEQVEADRVQAGANVTSTPPNTAQSGSPLKHQQWRLADRNEFVDFVRYSEGDAGPPAGVQDEQDVRYEYQLWVHAQA